MASARRNELIHRLLAGHCEICQARTNLEVHHVRKLANLNKPGRRAKPDWMHLRGRFGGLGLFRDESEYSGWSFGQDSAAGHAFELRAGAFDVFR